MTKDYASFGVLH